MNKWRQIKFGGIADFSNGINFDKSSYCKKGTFLIGVSDFGEELFPDYSTLRHIDSTIVRECNLLKDGDIVFVRSNGNKALVGRSMLIKNPPENTSFSGFCIRARIKNHESFDPLFFAYLFKSENFRKAIAGCSIGANIQNLSQGKLASYMAYVPSIEIQRKIADVLSAYDDLIENNRKQIKLLEEAAQRLYKEWFIDLRFPGHKTTPFVNGVPVGWEKVQLRELIAFNPKITITNDTIKTFIPMEALSTSSMVISTAAVSETSKNAGSKFEIGDTLLARITPCLENGKTAFVSDIDKGVYGVGSTEFIVLRSKKLNPYIVYLLARTEEFRNYAINSMTGSDGRQRVKVDKLEMYSTLLPSRKIIDSFGQIVAPYFEKVKVLSKAVNSCQEARDYLLPKLMTGELEVK